MIYYLNKQYFIDVRIYSCSISTDSYQYHIYSLNVDVISSKVYKTSLFSSINVLISVTNDRPPLFIWEFSYSNTVNKTKLDPHFFLLVFKSLFLICKPLLIRLFIYFERFQTQYRRSFTSLTVLPLAIRWATTWFDVFTSIPFYTKLYIVRIYFVYISIYCEFLAF